MVAELAAPAREEFVHVPCTCAVLMAAVAVVSVGASVQRGPVGFVPVFLREVSVNDGCALMYASYSALVFL